MISLGVGSRIVEIVGDDIRSLTLSANNRDRDSLCRLLQYFGIVVSLGFGFKTAQMLVKPVSEDFLVFEHVRPAVVFALALDELDRRADFLATLYKHAGLIDRHQFVRVAMH